MSTINFAKQVFGREKPHSSITAWVDILTGPNISEEAYDGIPELVESIHLQPTGPAEASRALRKKLKHGNSHHQYRAIVILNALVANSGPKFQTTFADGQLTDALKTLASDPATDARVRRKLLSSLLAWQNQFKDDPKMKLVAGLYQQARPLSSREKAQETEAAMMTFHDIGSGEDERRRREKELKKRKKKEEEAKRKAEQDERTRSKPKANQPLFDFEKEKPKVLTAIASATQASDNLANAIALVNLDTDTLLANERVQDCLGKVKLARKPIIRYIQLVENEELIGTLLETNERIIAGLETYAQLSKQISSTPPERQESAMDNLKARQLENMERANAEDENDIWDGPEEGESSVHPDLQDLNFGPLGKEAGNLPPPLRPTTSTNIHEESEQWQRGSSLSDYSDYDSSDEETRAQRIGEGSGRGKARKPYVQVSDNEYDIAATEPITGGSSMQATQDDPFADPFADDGGRTSTKQ